MKHLAITAFFIVATVLGISAQEVPPNAPPSATTKSGSAVTKLNGQQKTDSAKQKDSGQSPVPTCDGCFDSYPIEQPHTKTKEEESKEASLDRLYRRYLWATVIGVIGGLIGLGVLVWQAIISRRVVAATRDNARAAPLKVPKPPMPMPEQLRPRMPH